MSRYLWRTAGKGKRLHAFFIRSDRSIALTAICGVGPRDRFLNLPECGTCLSLFFRDEESAAPSFLKEGSS